MRLDGAVAVRFTNTVLQVNSLGKRSTRFSTNMFYHPHPPFVENGSHFSCFCFSNERLTVLSSNILRHSSLRRKVVYRCIIIIFLATRLVTKFELKEQMNATGVMLDLDCRLIQCATLQTNVADHSVMQL